LPRYIYDRDLIAAVRLVEGDDFDPKPNPDPNALVPMSLMSYQAAWENLQRVRKFNTDAYQGEGLSGLLDRLPADTYFTGSGGWHRYAILPDGEVVFVKAFSTSHGEPLATRAGFRSL
jgi:hypothetical protein